MTKLVAAIAVFLKMSIRSNWEKWVRLLCIATIFACGVFTIIYNSPLWAWLTLFGIAEVLYAILLYFATTPPPE